MEQAPPILELLQHLLNHRLQQDNDQDTEQLLQAAEQFLQYELDSARQRPIVTFRWYFDLIPFIYIDFHALWRRCRSDRLQRYYTHLLNAAAEFVVRLWRNLLPYLFTLYWLYVISRHISSLTSWVTFSRGFVSDILTYAVRNYPFILLHYRRLLENGANAPDHVKFRSVGQFFVDNLATSVHIVRSDSHIDFDRSSLIFKFSEVFTTAFPILNALPSFILTSFTILAYLSYGIGGSIFCFVTIGMLSRQIVKRYMPFGELILKLFKILIFQPNAAY